MADVERGEDDNHQLPPHFSSTSPAVATTHDLCAGWHSLQFVDEADEAAFVEKDFAKMQSAHLVVGAMQLFVLPFSLTPLGIQSRPITWPTAVLIILQLLVRWKRDWGAALFGWFCVALTIFEWVVVIAAERIYGFAPIAADNTIFVILFYIFVLTQGLVVLSCLAYWVHRTVLCSFIFVAFCTLHLYIYVSYGAGGNASAGGLGADGCVPTADALGTVGADGPAADGPGAAAPSGPAPTASLHVALSVPSLTPAEFLGLFSLIVTFCLGLVLAQLHARRAHHAELEYLHERLRREKERMHFELALSQKQQMRAEERLADGGGSEGGGSGGDAGSRRKGGGSRHNGGPRSARSVGSSGLSSGMSGYCDLAKEYEEEEGRDRDRALLNHHSIQRILDTPSPTEAAKRRQEVLWTTLSDIGIRPKSEASHDAMPML
jgi:hypothetical protein